MKLHYILCISALFFWTPKANSQSWWPQNSHTLSDLNGDVVNNLNGLQIIDKKIQIAQNYVDGLMANSSGAIGMLKDNKYNSMVLITENTAMALIIIALVYVYFRNNG